MIKNRWAKHVQRAALGGALGFAILACAQGVARAEDDDKDSIWNLDKKIMDDFMRGLGFRTGTEGTIDYRERSPLVVPATRSLPPPETNAQKAPNWPVDPNQKRRQEAAQRKDPRGNDPDHDSRALMPSELNPTGGTRASRATEYGANQADPKDGPLKPSELGYFGGIFSWDALSGRKDAAATFDREPPRHSLIDPPPGYQTPSPAHPYGLNTKPDANVTYGPKRDLNDPARD